MYSVIWEWGRAVDFNGEETGQTTTTTTFFWIFVCNELTEPSVNDTKPQKFIIQIIKR